MTQQHTGSRAPASAGGSPAELRADLERAREELAGTLARLVGKADVRARAREKASTAGSHLRGTVRQAGRQGRGRAKAAGAAGAALLSGVVLVLVRSRRMQRSSRRRHGRRR